MSNDTCLVKQATLEERWNEIATQVQTWYESLPDAFITCTTLLPEDIPSNLRDRRDTTTFPETWYMFPMAASTMQSYHMAQILLLINKPQHSTSGQSSVLKRLGSYRTITATCESHSIAICNIARSKPNASVRVHSVQPLFIAGQCLRQREERTEVLELLRSIEFDTGWATEYLVQQLLVEWGWTNGSI